MEDTKLIAKKRDLQGSSNSRRLRKSGMLPGVIYSEGKEAIAVQLGTHDFKLLLNHHTSESVIVEIEVEGEGDISALVKDVQHHPVSGDLLHVDLLRIDVNKPIQVEIEVELVGDAEGMKLGGSMEQIMHTIAIECLPGDLVDAIEVDVSGLEIGSSLHVSEIALDTKFKLLGDPEAIVASVSAPNAEEEDVEEGSTDSEPEVITAKKTDDAAE